MASSYSSSLNWQTKRVKIAAMFKFQVLDALKKHSSRVALSCDAGTLTYAELDAWSDSLCTKLLQKAKAKDLKERTVGLLAASSLEYVAGLYAIWKSGAMAVPLQPQHPQAELEYIVEDSKLEFVLAHPELLEQGLKLHANTQPITREQAEPRSCASLSNDQGALMIYTSGTTSRPKGVVLTFGNLEFQVATLGQAWGWRADDRIVNVLPLHHVHGVINILLCSLANGAHCELYARFNAQKVWSRLASGEVSVFMAVPTIYSKLAQHWESFSPKHKRHFSERSACLRLMVSGSAALPLPLFEKWREITSHTLLERYGMTEIGMALSNPYSGERKPRSVGRPLPGIEIKLTEEGEILVRGPNVFREYWGKPELTRDSFTADGWFKTGDLTHVTEDGYFHILGRASQDIIKCGGYKLSALEIESALLENAALAEVAVVALPDAEWGERVAAVCVWADASAKAANEASDYEHIKSWLMNKVAHYKVPTVWKSAAALPRNAMGKVTKPALKALF